MKFKIFAIAFLLVFIIGFIASEPMDSNEKRFSFGIGDNSILNFFPNPNITAVVVSNAIYDSENKMLYILENGYLKIKTRDKEGNDSELIYEKIREAIFTFDWNGIIDTASITSNGNSTYNFEGYEPIIVGNNTHLEYNSGILRVSGGENGHFKYGDLSILNFGDFLDLNGNQIICKDCEVEKINLKGIGNKAGILEKIDKGYLIKYGEATYQQNFLKVDNIINSILIADTDADLSGYNGNWLRQTSDLLEMRSSKTGEMNFEALESHEILNTDKKDLFSVKLLKGDGLKVQKREDRGLIPIVTHESSTERTASTIIKNGNFEFIFKSGRYSMSPLTDLSVQDLSEKYQTVAMILESDSRRLSDKIIINSYSQFSILKNPDSVIKRAIEGTAVITYNQYGLPVTSAIEDNELQTIEQMRQKYPLIEFNVPEKIILGGGGWLPNEFNEENLPPYYLYLTDIFLKSKHDATKNRLTINYNSEGWVAANYQTMALGGLETQDGYYREMTSPLQILIHEYEHVQDRYVEDREPSIYGYEGDYPFGLKLSWIYHQMGMDALGQLENNQRFKDYLRDVAKSTGYGFSQKDLGSENWNSIYMRSTKEQRNQINSLVRIITGLPYLYAAVRTSEGWLEISSTYAEQPIEQRRVLVQSANKQISNTYTKLTQLAFDSGKMGVEEYKAIMGSGFCKSADCSDKLCIEYILSCCVEHPNSPNCR